MTSVASILELISTLSGAQRVALDKALANESPIGDGPVTLAMKNRKLKSHESLPCPYCDSQLVTGSGNFHGRKRYKCGICAKTFTQLTKTPISKTRYPQQSISRTI